MRAVSTANGLEYGRNGDGAQAVHMRTDGSLQRRRTSAVERTIRDTRGHKATRRVIGPTTCRSRLVVSGWLINVEEVEPVADKPSDVLTADEAADYLRVSRKTLYRLVTAGKVPGQKVGRAWRFRREDLVDFLKARP